MAHPNYTATIFFRLTSVSCKQKHTWVVMCALSFNGLCCLCWSHKMLDAYFQALHVIISLHVILSYSVVMSSWYHSIPFFKRFCFCCLWVKAGYTLNKLPAHRRAVTDGICTSGAILGSVSCSRTLRHAARFSPGEPGFEPATFQSQADQLPLSYIVVEVNSSLQFCRI